MKSDRLRTSELAMAALDRASLAAAVEQAADNIVITDIDGTIQYVNPAFTALTGYTREEAEGQNPRILKSGRHPAEFYEALWSTIRSGRIWHGELTNRRKDGTLYDEEMQIAPVRGADGAITSYIAIKRDVTAKRAAENAQAFLAAIVEASEDAIVATTPEGVILTWNRGAENLLGFTAEQAIGQHAYLFTPPDRLSQMAWCIGQVAQGKPLTNYEGICQRAGGQRVPVTVTGFPIKDSAGKVVAITAVVRDDTASRASQQAQALLASIVESSDDAIVAATPAGVIATWNRGANAHFGYSADEIIGRPVSLLLPPEQLGDLESCLRQASQGVPVSQYESVGLRKDGSRFNVSVTSSPIRNSAAEVTSVSAVIRDITERKLFERRLRESEERFREVFEHAPVGIYVADPDRRLIQVNATFCQLLGFSEQELLSKSWPDLCPPDDLPAAVKRTKQLLSKQVTRAGGERRYIHRDGSLIWCMVTVSILGSSNRGPLFVVHVQDITERKRSEQALRESEERFRTIADSSPSMMWVTDASGKMEFINRAYREFSGLTCEEAQQGKWRSLIHPDDIPVSDSDFRLAIKEHKPFVAECRVRRADGQWRLAGTRAEPRFSPDGEFMGHIGLCADITERVKAEQEREFQHSFIRAIFEGSLDGILVVNSGGVVVSHNKRFLDIWKLSSPDLPDNLQGIDHRPLLSAVLERVRDTEGYRKQIEKDEHTPAASDRAEIELKDGRTLERYSTRLWNESGQCLGHARFFRDITERKQAEVAVRESEDRFRIMADGCPTPMWVTNTDGGIQFTNHAFRDFCGEPHNQVNGRKWELLIHPDDRPDFIRESNLAIREHSAFRAEARVHRADGEWRWLFLCAEPRTSTDGKFLGHVGLSVDITARKEAEKALQRSEENFRQLTENIREVFWMANATCTEILYISPAYEQIWGRTCQSLYEKPSSWTKAIHPDDRERANQALLRQLQGDRIDSEYRITTPYGQERWIRDRAFPIRDQAGVLIRIAGVAEDITERMRDEERLIRAREEAESAHSQLAAQHSVLERERKMLRTFIDNAPDLMYMKDTECKFVIANPETARWMGAPNPEELIGKTDFDFYPRELAGPFYEAEQHLIRTRQSIFNVEETNVVNSTEGVGYILSTKVPLLDSENRVIGLVGIGRNITRRKKGEDALRQSNLRLQEATARSNQLAMRADAANRAKSIFLANMSHEIRTPMNGVIGMNQLLLETELTAEQRRYAEVARNSGRTLLALIDDILDLSKIEAGKLEIDAVDFNLIGLMDDFAETMAERVAGSHLEFVCAVSPGVPAHLQGDPGRLRQVLQNLAGNSLKFTHHGEIVIRVSQVSENEDEVCLKFSVCDTGIGIPADKQGMLFKNFTQVDPSTTRLYGGTGLGLAISKQLVELMGGEIGLRSKEGEGSEFWFTVRLAKQPANKAANRPPTALPEARVLVVDDNATNREMLTEQLHSWGVFAVSVRDGAAALECLRNAAAAGNPFQLAALDMMMPGMDGGTLGRIILSDESLQATHLVIMTSIGQRGDAIRFREMGFAAYLTKPIRQSDLFDCLVTVLNGERSNLTRTLITRHSLREVRRGNARILLVEDNATNQEVAVGMLRRFGWKADIACDGCQAVQALENASYDLVLMDVQMPGMDGYEAARQIRDPHSMVLNHEIPIIALTAHTMAGDTEACFAAGMDDFISKPIDSNLLADVVGKWLTRKVHSTSQKVVAESAIVVNAPALNPDRGLSVFESAVFLQRMMGDERFAREVAAGFVKELPAMLGSLKEQVARGDLESVWKHAHKLKGSAANVGGEALRQVALQVEQAGKAGEQRSVDCLISELESQTAQLHARLLEWLNGEM